MAVKKLSRRRLLSDAGKVAAGAVIGAGILDVGLRPRALGAEKVPEWPWPYAKLDPDAVAERAYEAYYERGCMYGTFEGIVGELREKVGYPYTLIPTKMMTYGVGGVVGWSTLCGTLNGSSAAINLVTKDYDTIVNELMGWYTVTPMPIYKPQNPRVEIKTSSVSGSPICHVSVTKWCEAAGYKSMSPERKERCGRLAADVAAHAAELLNQLAAGAFAAAYTAPASVSECLACHGPDGTVGNTFGKMDCLMCHKPHG